MNFSEISDIINNHFNITLDQYDNWVAGHEAAHAVVAHHFNASIMCIETTTSVNNNIISRARTVYKMLGSQLDTINIMAAGVAYDKKYASYFGVPTKVLSHMCGDKKLAFEYMENINVRSDHQEKVWSSCIHDMSSLLEDSAIKQQINKLQGFIYQAIQTSTINIPGHDVVVIIDGT